MKRILSVILLAALLLISGSSLASAPAPSAQFTTEQSAQQHCPADIVVWLNLPTGIYHFKGQHWYASTKSGAYVCEKEADQAGDRPTPNNQ